MSEAIKPRLTQKERIAFITEFINSGKTPDGFTIKQKGDQYQIRHLKPKVEVDPIEKKVKYHQKSIDKLQKSASKQEVKPEVADA
jgi:hypothetical protein